MAEIPLLNKIGEHEKEIATIKKQIKDFSVKIPADLNKIANTLPKLKKIITLLDVDGDGKLTFKEIMNPELLKLLLFFVITIFGYAIIEWIQGLVPTADQLVIIDLLKFFFSPTLFVLYIRNIAAKVLKVEDIKDNNQKKELIAKDDKIKELEQKCNKLELEKINECAAIKIKETELAKTLEYKNREIEYIMKGYKLEDINKKL